MATMALTFDEARGYTFGAGILLLALGVLALLLIRRLLVRLVMVVILVGLATVFFVERTRISVDTHTCTATAFHITVSVPPSTCEKARAATGG